MLDISNEKLETLELTSAEQESEYLIELAKAKARFDAELFYENAKKLRRSNRQKSFIYIFIWGVAGACLGFLFSQIPK